MGPIQIESPDGCLGGSVMLVKSRRVRQRRLRPQAGCQIQPSDSTPVIAAATIRLHYRGEPACVSQLRLCPVSANAGVVADG